MEQEELKQLGHQFIDTLHKIESGDSGAIDAMAQMFSDDARITNSVLVQAGQEKNGQDGAREFWTDYQKTLGKARSDFHSVTTGDRAVGLFWNTKSLEGNHEVFDYDGATWLMFDQEGKIRRFHGYYDTRQLKQGINKQTETA